MSSLSFRREISLTRVANVIGEDGITVENNGGIVTVGLDETVIPAFTPAMPLAIGDMLYASSPTELDNVLPNTSTTLKILTQVGNGTTAGAPEWQVRNASITDFGAVGDGATDNYDAISAAMTYARSVGANLFVPSGRYRIDMTGRASLQIREMAITGEHMGGIRGYLTQTYSGAVFEIVGVTAAPFTMEYNATIRNVTFVWPQQLTPATPTIYPAGINITNGANVEISRVSMINAYTGINHVSGGFIWISDCRISAFAVGVGFSDTHAGNVISGCDFSYAAGDDFYSVLDTVGLTKRDEWRAYYSANSLGIQFIGISADAQSITNNTFFGCKAGVFITSAAECFLWGSLNGNHFDACYWGVVFSGKARPAHFTITGGTFNYQFSAATSGHIVLAMSGSTLDYDMTISGVRFSTATGSQIVVSAPDTQQGMIAISGCQFHGAGNGAVGGPFYGISVTSLLATIAVSGCAFDGLSSFSARGVLVSKGASLAMTGCNLMQMANAVDITTLGSAALVGNVASVTGSYVTGAATDHTETGNSWNATVTARRLGASAINLPLGSSVDVASMSLPAGDWDVSGEIRFVSAASANITVVISAIHTVSNTDPGTDSGQRTTLHFGTGGVASANPQLATPVVRLVLTTTTTVYLIASATFTVGTVTAHGGFMARRVR